MELQNITDAFANLGFLLKNRNNAEALKNENEQHLINQLNFLVAEHYLYNGWFTDYHVNYAIDALAQTLTSENLNQWISPYNLPRINTNPKNVGVIMADRKSVV